ncbi:unnamed protein product [Moneuplotes crassus]|uniref:Peptidase C1A papain C-terminal domain-containing protein n=1 Tax=Euplotes crassus TaxID=5936 RepID=A0AAD2D429_EUPCR|nr:unnamed protein product [Moneuplotes crassus]
MLYQNTQTKGFNARGSTPKLTKCLLILMLAISLVHSSEIATLLKTPRDEKFSSEAFLPDKFDAREKWPNCFDSLPDLKTYSSNDVLPAQILSERFCIMDPSSYNIHLSSQQIVECATEGGWKYLSKNGVMTKGCYPDFPRKTVCDDKCLDNKAFETRYFAKGLRNVTYSIREELMAKGPVSAPLKLGASFKSYTDGIFSDCGGARGTVETVKIVGWNREGDVPYWIVSTNRGSDWGENGYAKVQQTVSCSLFLEDAYAADPKI